MAFEAQLDCIHAQRMARGADPAVSSLVEKLALQDRTHTQLLQRALALPA